MPVTFLPGVKRIAVVGASRNPEKWGYKVLVALKTKYPDVELFPINPNASEIAGIKAYKSIEELPIVPDMVITVVKPEITEKVVETAKKIGVKIIWMQPGSESDEAIKKAEEAGIKVFHHTCIIESSDMGRIAFRFSGPRR